MATSSKTASQRGEKSAYLSTWVRPEVKKRARKQADREGVSLSEYVRRQLDHLDDTAEKTAATTQ